MENSTRRYIENRSNTEQTEQNQEMKKMTQQPNVPTFAEALRTAMAASVEATGPGVMIMGLRNDVWE
jgi:uncharacterized protein YlxW (UPF0749 family)